MTTRSTARGVLAAGIGLACLAAAAAVSAEGGDLARGQAKYEQYCAVCHGARGGGNGPMAKATVPPAARLVSRDIRKLSDEALAAIIANGKGSVMPGWGGVLTKQEVMDVVAYIRSLSGS